MFYFEVWPVRLAKRNVAVLARHVRPGRAVPGLSLTSARRVPRPPQAPSVRAKAGRGEGNANFRRSGKRAQEA